jgi:hypothetical protein
MEGRRLLRAHLSVDIRVQGQEGGCPLRRGQGGLQAENLARGNEGRGLGRGNDGKVGVEGEEHDTWWPMRVLSSFCSCCVTTACNEGYQSRATVTRCDIRDGFASLIWGGEERKGTPHDTNG